MTTAIAPPTSRFAVTDEDGAIATITRGLRVAPVLRRGLGLTFGLAMLGSLGRVVVPILIQQAIDRGIVGRDDIRVGLVVSLAVVAAVAIALSTLAFRFAALRLGDRSERALYDLREQLIGHIQQLSLADHNEERRGALVARVTSDIETLAAFFQWGGMAWMRSTTVLLIVGTVMLIYNWVLALTAFAIALPLVIVLRTVQRHLVRAYDRARDRNGVMLGALAEMVSGAPAIRAYGAGAPLAERVEEAVADKARTQIRANLIAAFLFPSGELFSAFTVSAVVAIGVWQGAAAGLTAGALVGFVFLTYRFLEPVAEFTEVIDQTQTAVAGLRRVLAVLDMPIGPPAPATPTVLPSGPLDVSIDQVTFAYPSRGDSDAVDQQVAPGDGPSVDGAVLSNVSAAIPAGQQVALVGATGSGKTTLGRLIARFADPQAGRIEIGGVDLRQVDRADLRSRLVVVSQEPFLFDDTVAANLSFARPGATRADIDSIIDDLGIRDWVDSLSNGVDTRVGERGGQISAGERQLVALLRAGLADPDVLILDEATSSVDALTEVRVARALERLARGRTTIAIAHRLSTAARSDRVLVLADGRLVEDGHHDELVEQDGIYRALYDAWVTSTRV